MVRRLLITAVAATCALTAVPSHAAAPVKLYLNELTDSCAAGVQNAITTSPDDAGNCVIVPRLLVDGQGLENTNESFTTVKSVKAFRIDATKPLTGTFALTGGTATRGDDGLAQLKAIFVVKMARKTVGQVVVEGLATPTGPVKKAYSLKLPSSLHNVTTNSVNVSVQWVTCVGLCGVETKGVSFLQVPTR